MDQLAGKGRLCQKSSRLMTGHEREQPIPDVTPAQPIDMVSLRTDKNNPICGLKRKSRDLAVNFPALTRVVGDGSDHHCFAGGTRAPPHLPA